MHIARRAVAGALTLLSLSLQVLGQDAAIGQERLMSKRSAEADAFRKLAEIVYGLQINATTTVRDFVNESDEIRGAVDTFVKGVRLGQPAWLADGTCEVPAEVTVQNVVETLKAAHSRHYKGDSVRSSDFESITTRVNRQVIRVVGQGVPRMALPPRVPEPAMEYIQPMTPAPTPPPTSPSPSAGPRPMQPLPAPPPSADPAPLPTPSAPPQPMQPAPPVVRPVAPAPRVDIWAEVGPQARLMAIRAARIDAIRRLAERIKGLRLTSNTMVRDFAVDSDEVRTMLDATLRTSGVEEGVYLHPDELIAEVTMRMPTEQVVTTIRELHSRHYKDLDDDDIDVRGHTIRDEIRSLVRRDFVETGMGVPPPHLVRRWVEASATRPPDWTAETFTAVGEARDPELHTPQGRLKAMRAAELDAKRRLLEQVQSLPLDEQSTIRDAASTRDALALELDAVVARAMVERTDVSDDAVRVTVALHGMEVWGLVNDPYYAR